MGESTGSNGLSNGNSGLFHQLSQSGAEPESPKPDLLNVSHLSNSNEEDFIAKPKAREWEKHKVPWMDELKASQAKKTSPNVSESKSPEHRETVTSSNNHHHHLVQEESSTKFDNISKSFHMSSTTTSSSVSASGRARLSERAATTSSVADVTSSTAANSVNNNNSSFDLIASSRKETTNSHHQHSLTNSSSVEQHSSSGSTTTTNTTTSNNVMTKSMSALSTKIAIPSDSANSGAANDLPTSTNNNRPVSVNLRNRSISPTPITRNTKTIHITSTTAGSAASSGSTTLGVEPAPPTNNGTSTTAIGGSVGSVTSDNVCSRVQDLEQKVNRMERQLTTQNNLIEDLKRLLREESDRVRTLQKELEKYAQCVTQV